MINELIHEVVGLVATIDPANNTSAYSDYVDMAGFNQISAILLTGNMSAHAIDFAVYGYTDVSASNETEIKAITQLAADGALNDNAQAIISVRNEDLTAKDTSTTRTAGGLRYVRAKMTSGSQSGYSAAVILGEPKQGPGYSGNLATVAEVEDDLS